jgi:hypothetical protein
MILDLLSVTRVHILIPMLSMSISLIGGSGIPKRKRWFIPNEEGVLVDEVVLHQRQREAVRNAQKAKLLKAQARHLRCSGYRGIPVHLLLGLFNGPASAQG